MELVRAPEGGEELFGKFYTAGEFLPFYIPRGLMPQIDWPDYGALFAYLTAHQEKPFFAMRPLTELHAHQRINKQIAGRMSDEEFKRPILVSADSFILDGNHRWLSHVLRGWNTIATVNLELNFDEAIKCLCQFPKAYYYDDGKKHQFN